MATKIKILIGYDGAPGADLALNDLRRAGLPREAEAFVLSVAEPSFLLSGPGSLEVIIAPDSITGRERAQALAEKAASRIRSDFPGWEVNEAAVSGSPAGELILKADEWGADPIVIGSHGHTTLGRFFLGSVSQTVVTQARIKRMKQGVDRSISNERSMNYEKEKLFRSLVDRNGDHNLWRRIRPCPARAGPRRRTNV